MYNPSSRPGGLPPLPRLRAQYIVQLASPIWMYVLLACNVLTFLAVTIYGLVVYRDPRGSLNGDVLSFFGMKVNQLIAAGEIWRLFTAMFLHIGELHLLSNLYALFAIGTLVEGYYGHRRFLAIYLLGGLFGSLASYAFSPADSAGASGAIFALVGAATVYFLRYHENFGERGRAILLNMGLVIVINLAFGFTMPYIDNWGHIGGLLGGIVVALGLLPRYKVPRIPPIGVQPMIEEPKLLWELLWIVLCCALLWGGLAWATQHYLGIS